MLNTEEAVLVLVDIQARLMRVMDRVDLVVPNTERIIKGCQALTVPVLPVVQVPEKLGPMPSELLEAIGEAEPVTKVVFSALREPDFLLALDRTGRRQVILAGMEAHVCIFQTALDLLDAGYQVHILADAVFSRSAENHQLALDRMRNIGATISSVEMALFEMLQTTRHPAFRTISKLVK